MSLILCFYEHFIQNPTLIFSPALCFVLRGGGIVLSYYRPSFSTLSINDNGDWAFPLPFLLCSVPLLLIALFSRFFFGGKGISGEVEGLPELRSPCIEARLIRDTPCPNAVQFVSRGAHLSVPGALSVGDIIRLRHRHCCCRCLLVRARPLTSRTGRTAF